MTLLQETADIPAREVNLNVNYSATCQTHFIMGQQEIDSAKNATGNWGNGSPN